MKKKYIAPVAFDIYSGNLLSVYPGEKTISGHNEDEGKSKISNVTVWDDEDDNWGADSYTGF